MIHTKIQRKDNFLTCIRLENHLKTIFSFLHPATKSCEKNFSVNVLRNLHANVSVNSNQIRVLPIPYFNELTAIEPLLPTSFCNETLKI